MDSNNKMNIGFVSFPDFSGNCKALYEDMQKIDCNYNLLWFCTTEKMTKKLNLKGIKAIWDQDEKFQEEFKKTKILINTHDYYMNFKNDNQIFINLWHGLGPKKIR